jgi:hypothetical protein
MADNDVIENEVIVMADAEGNPTDDRSKAVTIEERQVLRDGQEIMITSSGPAAPSGPDARP